MVDDDAVHPKLPPGAQTIEGPADREAVATTQPGGTTATPTQSTLVPSSRWSPPPVELPPPGYQLGEVIGRGGMGEVIAAHDQRIGREVAIKRMRSARPDGEQLARFLREARIQARLDHPAIVPVHELGTDEDGRPFFAMKRISGRTLGQRMGEGATQQALLRAFVDVCLAVELAHSRAVVHRDLKPANIMLGDYGEVYVLDWGVARVLTETKRHPTHQDIETLDDGTQTGAMLGTPGYMAPEQIKGLPATEGADIYALGSILFEILAGEPLHPRGTAAISSTLTTPQEAPAHRRSDRAIAPELDACCQAALAEQPGDRPTARTLADQVQAYLDGDRDLDRRRTLAFDQLAAARAALASSDPDARAIAIRRAGRAIALDPGSSDAIDLVTSLIVVPPPVLPPELLETLARDERKATAQRSATGAYALLSLFAFWLLIPLLEIKSWPWLTILFASLTTVAGFTYRASKTGVYNVKIGMLMNLGLIVVWTRIAGPFILTPVLICGALLAMTANEWFQARAWRVVVWSIAAIVLPLVLEQVGVLEHTWDVEYLAIKTYSMIFRAGGLVANLVFVFANIAFVTILGLFALRINRGQREAQRALSIQAWHLRHLMPASPSAWATPRPRG